ncbi:MAG: hypothetical protein QOI01_4871, partial [Mycobacterium sp.]|nr:hypothetical protein [Mycobacterium sp.]
MADASINTKEDMQRNEIPDNSYTATWSN